MTKLCRFLGRDLCDTTIEQVVEKSKFATMRGDKKANYEFLPQERLSGKFMHKGNTAAASCVETRQQVSGLAFGSLFLFQVRSVTGRTFLLKLRVRESISCFRRNLPI